MTVWDQDIRQVTPAMLMKQHGLKKGELDVPAGCPPCQGFSAMRRLNGSRRVRDKHSKDLVFDYLRFVEGLKPKVVLMENVPRLTRDYRFNEVRKRLRELGYVGQPVVFNAADFGVPQRRRRMVFKGRFLHPTQNRAITLREAALLQSFRPSPSYGVSGVKQPW